MGNLIQLLINTNTVLSLLAWTEILNASLEKTHCPSLLAARMRHWRRWTEADWMLVCWASTVPRTSPMPMEPRRQGRRRVRHHPRDRDGGVLTMATYGRAHDAVPAAWMRRSSTMMLLCWVIAEWWSGPRKSRQRRQRMAEVEDKDGVRVSGGVGTSAGW